MHRPMKNMGGGLRVFNCVKHQKTGVRQFVPDEFVFGVLDNLFAVGIWGFWARDEFWEPIVTDSQNILKSNLFNTHINSLQSQNSLVEKANLTFNLIIPSDLLNQHNGHLSNTYLHIVTLVRFMSLALVSRLADPNIVLFKEWHNF